MLPTYQGVSDLNEIGGLVAVSTNLYPNFKRKGRKSGHII